MARKFRKGAKVTKMSLTTMKKKVAALDRKVKAAKPEVKNHYRVDDVVVPNYTGTFYNLAAIPQSVGPQGRIGNKVHAIRLKSRLDFKIVPTPDDTQSVRIMIIRDLSNSVTGPSDVLNSNGTVNAVNAAFNDEARKRYRVLYDKRFNLCNYGGGRPDRLIMINKKLNFDIGFDDADTSLFTNNLKLFVISDVATTASAFTAVHELMYTDV